METHEVMTYDPKEMVLPPKAQVPNQKIAAALAKAHANIGAAEKTAANTFHKSKYATLGDVIAACKQALSDVGVSVLQLVGSNAAGAYTLTTTLLHESGESISTSMILPIPAAKMGEAQAMGSSVTYCRRYQLQALMNIPAVDDDGEWERRAFHEAQNKPADAANPSPEEQKRILSEKDDEILTKEKERLEKQGIDPAMAEPMEVQPPAKRPAKASKSPAKAPEAEDWTGYRLKTLKNPVFANKLLTELQPDDIRTLWEKRCKAHLEDLTATDEQKQDARMVEQAYKSIKG